MSGMIAIQRERNYTKKSELYLHAKPLTGQMDGAANISIDLHKTEDYELIFRQYYEALCNYANNWLRDMDHAEEVVQEVFVKLWEKKQSLNIEGSVKAYLYKSVYNTAMNEIRRGKMKEKYVNEASNHEKVTQPSEGSALRDLEKRIETALQELPEQCRLVFRMSRFEELKYREIADVLNISVKTVENQMGKALRIMRENLSDYLVMVLVIIKFLAE